MIAAVTAVILALSTALGASSAAGGDTSLKQDVMPILNQRCVMCHIPGAALAGLDLYTDPWAALVNAKSTQSPLNLVVPGKADESYFYLKLVGTHLEAGGSGLQMPIQQDLLDPAQLEIIRSWIESGAPNN